MSAMWQGIRIGKRFIMGVRNSEMSVTFEGSQGTFPRAGHRPTAAACSLPEMQLQPLFSQNRLLQKECFMWKLTVLEVKQTVHCFLCGLGASAAPSKLDQGEILSVVPRSPQGTAQARSVGTIWNRQSWGCQHNPLNWLYLKGNIYPASWCWELLPICFFQLLVEQEAAGSPAFCFLS